MAVPPMIVKNDAGVVISIVNRDPKLVDPQKCVHNPDPGQPRICMCTHDWSIAGAVGSKNAETGADGPWGPLPKPIDQTGLPK